jgi:hypothetical protein
LRGARQQFAHFVIARLRKIFVILAYSLEKIRPAQTNDLVGFMFEFAARIGGSDRNSHNNFGNPALPQCRDRRSYGCTGRQSIIHKNNDSIA